MDKFKFMAVGLLFIVAVTFSCGKENMPDNLCAGVTVLVTGTVTNTSAAGASNGAINAAATGGAGFTFALNSGSFQSSSSFTGLTAGTYTVTAKNANGCTGTKQFSVTEGNACAGVNIIVSFTTSSNAPCATANGCIKASASGSTGFTFSLNNGSFQSSGTFTGLTAGTYTVTAKDTSGCTGSATATVNNATAGPKFSDVKGIVQSNCVSCHNNSSQSGGMNFSVECNIIQFKARIKARAVDNSPSAMPPSGPLSQSDKDKITAWINAGGKFTD